MNLIHCARPYARAAFEYALEHQALDHWTSMLRTVAAYIQDNQIALLLVNPKYNKKTLGELVLSLIENQLDIACKNFIELLSHNGRLTLLPDIYLLFQQFCTAIQATRHVRIESATPLTKAHLNHLQITLSKRFGLQVILETKIEPHLLGGFIVYSEDHVIDHSVRGKFEQLKAALI